jgi:hypothetical protein
MKTRATPKSLYVIHDAKHGIYDAALVGTVPVKWPDGWSRYCFTSKAQATKQAKHLDELSDAKGRHTVQPMPQGGVIMDLD